jgi:1A family penicillin-binding protein
MKVRTVLSLFGRFLENLGKPILYLFLGFIYLFIFASSKTGYFLYFLADKVITLISSIKIPKVTLKRPKIKLPSFPSFSFPAIKLPRLLVIGLFLFFLIGTLFTAGYLTLVNLPKPDTLITRKQPLTTKILDRNGQLLYKIYRNQNRTLVKLEDIPTALQKAVIAVEDAEFYTHPGFSVRGIFRAFNKILASNKIQGGSTITQQLIKNTLLTPEKTLKRKIQEIILSVWVEKKFTKDQILQMYLNEVSFGGTNYGVEEAAQTYFGKSVRDLDLAESALLAGLPASPTTYSPYGASPELAKERQGFVLDRMTQEGFITQEQAQLAKEESLKIIPQQKMIKAPHFVMYVKDQLVKNYGENMVEEGGLEVTTSLDLALQEQAENIVKNEVNKIEYLHVQNGAALITKPATGEILAMVGSKDYFDISNQGNYNVTTALRQPGSSIKPVNYSVALSMGFTAASIIPDTPITYYVPGQPPYSPKNYDGRFRGNVSLRTALGSSLNIPAVKVLSAIGVSRMIDQGKKLGITTWDDTSRFGLSLTLGGGEVKMVDMAVVYGTLANLGNKVQLNPILEVKDSKGKILKDSETTTYEKVLAPEIAFILNDILSDNNARTPIFGSHSLLVIPGKTVAAKTGTTNNLKDNWALGYTPSYLALAWVGNNNSSPMSQVTSGVSGATPIWHNIMIYLLKDKKDEKWLPPSGLVRKEICTTTGVNPCPDCPSKTFEWFLIKSQPNNSCENNGQ